MRLVILFILSSSPVYAGCDQSKAVTIFCHLGRPVDLVNLDKLRSVHHALQYCDSLGVTLVRAKEACAVVIKNI